jgi:invasion protein IalB
MRVGGQVYMSKYAFITAGLLVISAPALAQIVIQDTPTPVPTAKNSGVKSDTDKVICRMQETIGSRLQSHQVCLTKQQWWQFEQDNKTKVQEIQSRAPGPSSG